MKQIEIKTECIKLDQILKYASIFQTGGQSKIFIKNGYVEVNDKVITERGKKIKKGDKIKIKGLGEFIVV